MKELDIEIHGQHAQIQRYTGKLPIGDLRDVCSFMPPNADFIIDAILEKKKKDMKEGDPEPTYDKEDLRYHLLKDLSLVFPAGLVNDVKDILEADGFNVFIKANYTTELDKDWEKKEAKNFPELWLHEKHIVDEALLHRRGLIKAPTGSGKTLVGVWLWGAWGKPFCVILVPRNLIADQWLDELELRFPDHNVGIWYGRKKPTIGKINIMTYDKLKSIIKRQHSLGLRLVGRTKMIIADECDIIGAEKYGRPNKTYGCMTFFHKLEIIYGLSATAVMREDGSDIYQYAAIGDLLLEIPPDLLIKRKILSVPRIFFKSIPAVPLRDKDDTEDNFKYWRYVLENAVFYNDYRNKLGVKDAKTLRDNGRQVLIITPETKHINRIMALPEVRMETRFQSTHGKDPNVNNKIQMFKDGFTRILLCTENLIGRGINIPSISGIILLGAWKSATMSTQFVGRGIRKYNNKLDCIIIDYADGTELLAKHALARAKTWLELGYEVNVDEVSWMKRILK